MADYTAQINLTAQDNASATIRKIAQEVVNLQNQMLALVGSTTQLNAQFGALRSAGNTSTSAVNTGLASTAAGAKSAEFSVRQLVTQLRYAYVLAVSGYRAGSFLTSFIREGVEFNATIEATKIGLAATIATYKDFSDATGRAIEGQERFTLALAEAENVQRRLQAAAFRTTVTYQDLTKGFNTLSAAAGNQKASTAEIVKLVETVSNLSTSLNIPADTAFRQMSMALMGISRSTGQIGGLLRTLKIDNETLRSWRDQGISVQMLQKKLEEFGKIGPVINQTFKGALSNVKDVIEQVAGIAAKPVSEALKRAMTDTVSSIAKPSEAGVEFDPRVIERVKKFGDAAGEVTTIVAKMIPAFADLGLSILTAFTRGTAAMAPLFNMLGLVAQAASSIIGIFGEFGVKAAILGGSLALVAKGLQAITMQATINGLLTITKLLTTMSSVSLADTFAKIALNASMLVSQLVVLVKTLVSTSAGIAGLAIAGAYVVTSVVTSRIQKKFDDEAKAAEGRAVNAQEALARKMSTKAMSSGQLALADEWSQLAEQLRKGTIAGEEADRAFMRLRATMSGREVERTARDIAELNAQLDKIARTNIENKFIGKTGIAAQIQKERELLDQTTKEFLRSVKEETNPEKQQALREKMDAERDRSLLQQEEYTRRAEELRFKDEESLRQYYDRIALLHTTGIEREVLQLQQERDRTVRELNQTIKVWGQVGEPYVGAIKNAKAQQAAAVEEYVGKLADVFRDARASFERELGKESNQQFIGDFLETFFGIPRQIDPTLVQHAIDAADKVVADIEGDTLKRQIERNKKRLDTVENLFKKLGVLGTEEQAALDDARRAVAEEGDRLEAQRQAQYVGSVESMWAAIKRVTAKSVAELRGQWEMLANGILNSLALMNDPNAGATAGMARVLASIPTIAESAAASIQDVWKALSQGFNDTVLSVLTNRVNDLESVFRNLANNILKSWSAMLTEMVQRWFAAQTAIGSGGYSGKEFRTSNYGPGGSVTTGGGVGTSSEGAGWAMGGLGLLGGAYGVGSAFAQGGGGVNRGTGAYIGAGLGMVGGVLVGATMSSIIGTAVPLSMAAIGASIGSIVPIIGTAIGAIIGAIIGSILSPNTEQKLLLKGSKVGPNTEVGEKVWGASSVLGGQFADLVRSGAPNEARGFIEMINATLRDYIKNFSKEVHAGSTEDLQKDLEFLFKTQAPREMISRLFGQRQAGQDLPGISGGTRGSGFDESAPIPAFLNTIGFSWEKINEIAQKINTKAPEEFMQYLQSLVGVVIGVNKLKENLSKSAADIFGEFATADKKSPAEAFRESAESLAQRFRELDQYTGDEQIRRAQELVQLANERYEQELQQLRAIYNMIESFGKTIDAQVAQVEARFLSPDQIKQQTQDKAWEGRYGVLSATTPEEVQRNAENAIAAVGQMLDILFSRLSQAKTLLASFEDLGTKFSAGYSRPASAYESFFKDAVKLQGDAAAASKLSGQEQLDAMEEVRASAESLWERQKQLLEEIWGVMDRIGAAFASTIKKIADSRLSSWETTLANKDIASGAYTRITGATTPAQVEEEANKAMEAITSIVDGLMARIKRAEGLITNFQNLATGFRSETGGDYTAENYAVDAAKVQADLAAAYKLSGDAQLDALEAVGASAEALLGHMQELLNGLAASSKSIASTLKSNLKTIDDMGKSTDEIRLMRSNTAWSARGKIGTAQTGPEVEAAFNETAAAVMDIITNLSSRLKAARELLDGINSLSAKFGTKDSLGPIEQYAADAQKVQQDVIAAMSLSGDAQIEAIQKVKSSAEEMYSRQAQLLATIKSQSEELTRSIASAKFDIDMSLLKPEQQSSALWKRYEQIMGSLSSAKTPEEVQRLTQEAQSIISRYYGLFKEGDPNRTQAAADAKRALDTLDAIAQKAYKEMSDKIASSNEQIRKSLETAAKIVSTNLDSTAAEIKRWKELLIQAEAEAQARIGFLKKTITDTSSGIATGLESGIAALRENINDASAEIDRWVGMLTWLGGVTEAKLGGMADQVQRAGKSVADTLTGPGGVTATLKSAVDALVSEIGRWKQFLIDLKGDIGTKLTDIADDIVATNALLNAEMERTKNLFTQLNRSLEGAPPPVGGPKSPDPDLPEETAGVIQPMRDLATNSGDAASAVAEFAAALRLASAGLGASANSGISDAAFVYYARRNGSRMATRTA